MTEEQFKEQIKRLRAEYGDKYYGAERIRLLKQMFLKDRADEFEAAITQLICNARFAPLGRELDKEMQLQRNLSEQRLSQSNASLVGIMENAYDPAQYDDPDVRERIQGRIQLVKDYTRGKLTKKQFSEGCDFYDRAGGIPMKHSCT